MRTFWQCSAMALILAMGLPTHAQTAQGKATKKRTTAPNPNAVAMQEAEQAMEARDFATAESKLKSVLAEHPENYRAWFDLGYVYHSTDRTPLAIDAYRKSVKAQPGVLEPTLNLGILLAQAGDGEAGQHLRVAEKLKPNAAQLTLMSQAWMELGRQLTGKDQAGAIDALTEAARLSPKVATPHLLLGELHERAKDLAGAEREYKLALSIEAESSDALALLSNLYMSQNRFAEAEGSLRQFLRSQPQDVTARLQLGRVLAAGNKHEDAVAEYEKALQLKPTDADAARALADSQLALKRYPAAVSTLTMLASKSPNDAEVRFALGRALVRSQKYGEAQQELIAAVKLNPNTPDWYGELALAASGNKDYPLAIQALNARAKLEPDNAGTYFLRATCYDHLGAAKEASEQYKQFLAVANGRFPDEEWKARHRLIAIDPESRKKK